MTYKSDQKVIEALEEKIEGGHNPRVLQSPINKG